MSLRENAAKPGPVDLLLLGASTRALADSVRRSRFRGGVLAFDLFGDVDLEEHVRCRVLGRDLPGRRGTATLFRAAIRMNPRPRRVMFAGGMETHPRLLATLGRQVKILGNRPRDVAAVRDPARFFGFLEERGLPHPRTWPRPWRRETRRAGSGAENRGPIRGTLLWKPRRGGAGLRIRATGWRRQAPGPAGRPVAPGGYLQQRVAGVPGSVAFIADGKRARILGYCRGLSGEPGLGAPGFAYCGSLWGPAAHWLVPAARAILVRAVTLLTARFGLRGLNGLDFILARGRPFLLEINPRYTASMELIEEGWGRSLFALHREACLAGRLPDTPGAHGVACRGWRGKGILYAPAVLEVDDTGPFLSAGARDIPRPGSTVRAGAPVCTLVVRGRTHAECRTNLLDAAAGLRRVLFPGRRARLASW